MSKNNLQLGLQSLKVKYKEQNVGVLALVGANGMGALEYDYSNGNSCGFVRGGFSYSMYGLSYTYETNQSFNQGYQVRSRKYVPENVF